MHSRALDQIGHRIAQPLQVLLHALPMRGILQRISPGQRHRPFEQAPQSVLPSFDDIQIHRFARKLEHLLAQPLEEHRADRFGAAVELEHRQRRSICMAGAHGRGHRALFQRPRTGRRIDLRQGKIDEADEHRPGEVQVVVRHVDHGIRETQQPELRQAEHPVEAVGIRIAIKRDRRRPDDEQGHDQVRQARRGRADVVVVL